MKKERIGDRNQFLKGGLNFQTGKSKPLEPRKGAPVDDKDESDHQVSFFAVIRQNCPVPPVRTYRGQMRKGQSRIQTQEILTDEKYLNHPFYVLTKVRHFPNGGFRHARVAEQLRAEGVRPGALDIYLDAARRGFYGLRIEMKSAGGELSDRQEEEIAFLRREGYSAHVCWHYVEALEVLIWYLDIPRERLRGYPSWHAFRLPSKGHNELCGCDFKIQI